MEKHAIMFLLILSLIVLGACDDDSSQENNINSTNNINTTGDTTLNNTVEWPDFTTHQSDPGLLFELSGIVNSYEDLVNQTAVNGIGHMTLLEDGIEAAYVDRPVVTEFLPEDRDPMLVLSALGPQSADPNPHENHVASGTYSTIYVYLFRHILEEKLNQEEALLYGEEIDAAIHVKTNYYVRKDGMRFYRRCNALVDTQESGSVVALDTEGVDDFSVGQLFSARGNIILSDDPEVIEERSAIQEEDNGEFCIFIIDGVYVDAATFYDGLESELALTCELPEGFLDPTTTESLRGLFKGEIVEFIGNGSEAGGPGNFVVSLTSGQIPIQDTNRFVALEERPEGDLLRLVLMGGYQTLGADHIRLNMLNLDFFRDELVSQSASGLTTLAPEAVYAFSLYDYEYKSVGGVVSYKVCPLATLVDATAVGELRFCDTGNTDFSVGEPFELAVNIPLTSDASAMVQDFGEVGFCSCARGDEEIDCGEF